MLFAIKTPCHFVSSWYKRALRQENGADYDLRKINEISSLESPYLATKGPTRHCVSELWHSRRKSVRKLLKIAGEPVSRILLAAIARGLTIIPLGRNSRYDSSSLPEGCSRPRQQALKFAPRSRERRKLVLAPLGEPGRLSPPIWPCTTRGFPCLACCQL